MQINREDVVQAALTVERWCKENFEKNKNGKCDCPFCQPPYDEDLCRFWPCKPRVWDMEAFLRERGLKHD